MNRSGRAERQSKETTISVDVGLEGGKIAVQTGLPFFDHLLEAFARHGRFGLLVSAKGDLEIDPHHTVEDVGIVLGQALRAALGDRCGIERTGHAYMPMDEALVRAAFDLSGRPYLAWRVTVPGVYTPTIDLTVLEGFWKALCDHLGANLHVDTLHGRDYHHVCEAVFKACGRALRAAARRDGTVEVASTKGMLDG
ncbi:MAG: imidazoleglycerol-phosphate dehydratase HisB [Deltaproteobacteria bacterium]|nr:imidazoleglycerol-phosphate dehydratase HisB [Deltaproteobacteria bacterium]